MFLLATSIASWTGEAKSVRDPKVRAEWMKTHPCPSTGKTRGACPGWQADHVRSLCSGGKDVPDNLMWLEVDQHRLKSLMDVKECAIIRREKKDGK